MKVRRFQNLQFYQDLVKNVSDKNYINPKIIQHIQKWKTYNSIPEYEQFFKDLEQDHNYIQWLFPNFFSSMFNSNSYRLDFDELQQMRDDKEIINQLIYNLEMMKMFFGLKFEPKELLELFDKQFDSCFNKHIHNRLRIKRILSCLRLFSLDSQAEELLQVIKSKGQKHQYFMKYYETNYTVFSQKIESANIEYYLQKDLLDEKNILNLLNILNQKSQTEKEVDKKQQGKQKSSERQQKQSKLDKYKQKPIEVKRILKDKVDVDQEENQKKK